MESGETAGAGRLCEGKINWNEPLGCLGGLSAGQWLEDRYPDAEDARQLAKELAGLLGIKGDLYQRVIRQASIRRLGKSDLAREVIAKRIGKVHRIPTRPLVHLFNDWPTRKWDRAVITTDWHIPYWNPWMAERMMRLAQNWKPEPIRNLGIGADFVDFGQLSIFLPEEEEVPRKLDDDLDHVKEVLDWLLAWFEDLLVLKGNHEARLSKVLNRQIGMERLGDLVSVLEQFKWSNWSWCVIEDSLGNRWRLTHPGKRWKLLNRLAQELANRYQSNILLAHSHVMSVGYNISGDHITVDTGGMYDPEAIGYQIKTDGAYWRWVPGFLIIDRGKLHVFNDLWTPWSMYEDWLGIDLSTKDGI
jgi:hypothetical protein